MREAGAAFGQMEEKPSSFLLGEVWEDGSNKIAYDQRRRYLLGRGRCPGARRCPA